MLRSLGSGVRTAVGQPWLAALLWAWSAALSLVATLPAAVWLSRGLSLRPRGDVLLDGFSFDVLKELLHYDASPVATVLGWAAFGPIALAALASALVNGGLLEVLWAREPAPDPRPRLHRFFRGAGRYVLVHVRVLALSALVAAVALVAALAALTPLLEGTGESQREVVAWFGLLAPLIVGAVVVAVWGTVLDFARLRVVATDDRRAVRALAWAAWYVARHPLATVGLWTVMGVLTLTAGAAAVLLVPFVPVRGWAGIVGIVAAQQAIVFVRAWLRVATVAGEIAHAAPRGVGIAAPAGRGAAAPVAAEPVVPFAGDGI